MLSNQQVAQREAVARALIDSGAVAVIRMGDPAKLMRVAEAILKGGIASIEITMTTPNALGMIEHVAQEMGDQILLGVGSVIDRDTVKRAIDAGARYVVSPIFKPELVEASHLYGAPVLPGVFTPTEIQMAHEAGADMIKVFPADLAGMSYIKAVRAPLPHLKLVPTGGVTPENAGDWIRAGAVAVGVGSALTDKKAIADGDFDILTQKAKLMKENIEAARAEMA